MARVKFFFFSFQSLCTSVPRDESKLQSSSRCPKKDDTSGGARCDPSPAFQKRNYLNSFVYILLYLCSLHGSHCHHVVVGQSLFITPFALHLALQLLQLTVSHLNVTRANVPGVDKVCGLSNHRAIYTSSSALWRLLSDAASKPLAPHITSHCGRIDGHWGL